MKITSTMIAATRPYEFKHCGKILMTEDHTYRVVQEIGGKTFIGTCTEFPDLSFVGSDEASTLAGIKTLVHEEMRRIDGEVKARNFQNPWDEEQKP